MNVAITSLCCGLFACSAAEIGEGRQLRVVDASADGLDGGVGDLGVGPDTGEAPQSPFAFATVGRRCTTEGEEDYIVLSEATSNCIADANSIDAWQGISVATAQLPQTTGDFVAPGTVCFVNEGCQTVPITFSIDTWTGSFGASGRWGFDLPAGGRAEGEFNAGWCEYDEFLGGAETLASDLAITRVSVLQGTTAIIVEDGATVLTRNAPVVQGRPALLRLHVERDPEFVTRDVVARLTLDLPGRDPEVFTERMTVTADSEEADLDTTFNFDLPIDYLQQGLEWRVGLFEVSVCESFGTDTDQARFPPDGSFAPMNAISMGSAFNVVLVPFRYNADGSGRLPDTSEGQLERYRNTMYALYPVSAVNLSVREPVDFDIAIPPLNTTGWGALLSALFDTRAADEPPDNTYYYGIVAPASSIRAYCSGGCVAGLGPVPDVGSVFRRGAVGLGFTGQGSAETFAHEVGHATGRRHAPCGVGSADPSYPHAQGRLGVFGYNVLTGGLRDPNRYRDIMGYCDPAWISDYNYSAIFERIRAVNNSAPLTAWPTRTVRIAIAGEGRAIWGDTVTIAEPFSVPVTVHFENAAGDVVETDVGDFVELDHAEEGMYLIPDLPRPGAVRVRLPNGQRLELGGE